MPVTYRAFFPGGMMFMLPLMLTLYAVCGFPTPFFPFAGYAGRVLFGVGAMVSGYILFFRTAWTIRLEGDELRWRSVFRSGRLPLHGLGRIRLARRGPQNVDTMFASGTVVFTWRDGRSIGTMTGPSFSWLVETLIARVPGLQVDLGRDWAARRRDWGRWGPPR